MKIFLYNLFFSVFIILSIVTVNAKTYIVKDATDNFSSDSTLRAYIDSANFFFGADTIRFKSSLSGSIIVVSGSGYYIYDTLLIDGDIDGNGTPDIAIKDTNVAVPIFTAFDVNYYSNITIKGLNIQGFDKGISIGGMPASSNINVLGCHIGTNLAGTAQASPPTGTGIDVNGGTNIYIGDGTVLGRNIISGNMYDGIYIGNGTNPADNVQVFGNIIGLNKTGTVAIPNGNDGIFVDQFSSNVFIGNNTPGGRNVISGNGQKGIELFSAPPSGNFITNCVVTNNYIGTDITGNNVIGNTDNGVYVFGGANVSNVKIGDGTTAGRNVISGNGSDGIGIEGDNTYVTGPHVVVSNNNIGLGSNGTTKIPNSFQAISFINNAQNDTVLNNRIVYDIMSGANGIYVDANSYDNVFNQNIFYGSNAFSMISIDAGGQNNIQPPTIDTLTSNDSTIHGTSLMNAVIQVYATPSFDDNKPQIFLGTVTANAVGSWSFKLPFYPHGHYISAIQDSVKNTSSYGSWYPYGIDGVAFYVNNTDTVDSGWAYLYEYNSNQPNPLKLLDSTDLLHDLGGPSFVFYDVYPGQYMIRAKADKIAHPKAVPTWYQSSNKWFNAQVITVSDGNEMGRDITVKEIPVLTGSGRIFGKVKKGVGVGKIQGPGDPLGGVDVSLIDKSTGSANYNLVVGETQTKIIGQDSGAFEFNNIPYGTYQVHVDIAGIPIDTITTYTVDSTMAEVTDIEVTVDSNMISFSQTGTGIYNNVVLEQTFKIWPNPMSGNWLRVEYTNPKQQQMTVSLYDILGNQVSLLYNGVQHSGRYATVFNLNNIPLSQGNYFIYLKAGEEVLYKKLIVLK